MDLSKEKQEGIRVSELIAKTPTEKEDKLTGFAKQLIGDSRALPITVAVIAASILVHGVTSVYFSRLQVFLAE